jgi:Big-like domain-containing protein
MNAPYGSVSILSTLLAISAVGCGGEGRDLTTPRSAPQQLQIISGNDQSALRGDEAIDPLRVRAVGSDNQPVAGVTVRWAAAQGEASLHPPQSATDANGEAETSVTAGSTLGTVLLSATVEAVSPVVFTLTTLDPCVWTKRTQLESPVTGELRPLDCVDEGLFWDLYSFTVESQQAVTIRTRSANYDTRSWLLAYNGMRLLGRAGSIDSTDASTEAVAKAILAPGDYWAGATSFLEGTAGPYELLVSATSPQADSCDEEIWVVRGVTTDQQLASTDCVDASGPFYHDVFSLVLWAGERLTVTQSSTHFAPRLRLLLRSGNVIAEVDGNATGTATIDFTAELERGEYIVEASSAEGQQSGAYNLTVADPAAEASGAARLLEVRRPTLAGPLAAWRR